MKNSILVLLIAYGLTSYAQHPNLESVLKSNDLSYLVHNNVASHNPTPHGWEKFSHAQSPLGRFTFPLVMAMHSGEVYSLIEKGQIVQHTMTSQQWLPWLFQTENSKIMVQLSVGKDIFMSKISSTEKNNMAVLEMNAFTDHYYRGKNAIEMSFNKTDNQFLFTWDEYTLIVTFDGASNLEMCQNAQPMLRKFQGYNDVVLVDKSTIGCWNRNGITYLGASFEKELTITMQVIKKDEPKMLPDFAELVASEKQYWTDFFNQQVPVLKTKDRVIRETYYHAWVTFWSNRFEGGDGMTPYPYMASSAFLYPAQFFWDEFYHSILLSNLKNKELPYQFVKNFAFAQAPDGGMPGSLSFTRDVDAYRKEVADHGSNDMQPLFLGVTLQYLNTKPGWPKDRIPEMYEVYNKYVDWLYKNKDINGNGLVEYTNSYHSGADDSPRFDSVYPSGKHIGEMQAVESVEQNVWLSLMHYNLSEMAKALGNRNASKLHAQKAAQLEDKIEKLLWNEAEGFYYDLNTFTNQQIKVKTAFGFMAMFLKHSNKERMQRLIKEHLLNPDEFWVNYPIPSVAASESAFNTVTMWRGPVWPNVNWLLCLGLEQQGYVKEAKELALKTVQMVGPEYKDSVNVKGPRFNEWFNPVTGEPLGNENMSWSCTVADLILRYLDE